jgi:hypothetical protein
MSEQGGPERSESDIELEREIRHGRKFTLQEAIGRLAGPGAMKGESPVARLHQAEIEIGNWLRCNVQEAGGALAPILHRYIQGSELLLNNFEHPFAVLTEYCQQVLRSEYLLHELVRDADAEWGRTMGERPHFNEKDAPVHPDDPYTLESVRNVLTGIVQRLAQEQPPAAER